MSTTLEDAILADALAYSTLTDELEQGADGGVYFHAAPPDCQVPYVVFRKFTGAASALGFGEQDWRQPVVRFEVVSASAEQLIAIESAIISRWNHRSGTVQSIVVLGAVVENVEQPFPLGDGLLQSIVEVAIEHQEP